MATHTGVQVEREDSVDVGGGLDDLAASLRALGNGRRLRLLQYLSTARRLEDIAAELRVTRQTAQEHVQRLIDAGVVQRSVRGRRGATTATEYLVVPQRLFSLDESFGRLCGIELESNPATELRPLTRGLATEAPPSLDHERPALTIVHGMRLGRVIALPGQGPWLLGRERTAAACLDYDPFVSWRHAELRQMGDGFELVDLYSRNGTYLDWKRLARGDHQALENGGLIRVGRTLLLFRLKM